MFLAAVTVGRRLVEVPDPVQRSGPWHCSGTKRRRVPAPDSPDAVRVTQPGIREHEWSTAVCAKDDSRLLYQLKMCGHVATHIPRGSLYVPVRDYVVRERAQPLLPLDPGRGRVHENERVIGMQDAARRVDVARPQCGHPGRVGLNKIRLGHTAIAQDHQARSNTLPITTRHAADRAAAAVGYAAMRGRRSQSRPDQALL